MSQEAKEAFEGIKKIIAEAIVSAIDENIPFEVETDASEVALAATLNQRGRPVAFSRTLQGSELKHSAVEKEAQAIVESIRHWRHFLTLLFSRCYFNTTLKGF
jgi:CTP:molybdopterin cytidylyltransferase MocA